MNSCVFFDFSIINLLFLYINDLILNAWLLLIILKSLSILYLSSKWSKNKIIEEFDFPFVITSLKWYIDSNELPPYNAILMASKILLFPDPFNPEITVTPSLNAKSNES